jgi:predicted SnoaL-like aldol condensation-catalyzing enzyme
MSNKELAIGFLHTVVANKVREAYEKFIAADFIHHNQYFKGDRQSLMLAMEEAHRENPNTKITIEQVFEDGDRVVIHSLVKHQPEDMGFAVVHIFRFHDQQIVELWDLAQAIIENSPNENGLF